MFTCVASLSFFFSTVYIFSTLISRTDFKVFALINALMTISYKKEVYIFGKETCIYLWIETRLCFCFFLLIPKTREINHGQKCRYFVVRKTQLFFLNKKITSNNRRKIFITCALHSLCLRVNLNVPMPYKDVYTSLYCYAHVLAVIRVFFFFA